MFLTPHLRKRLVELIKELWELDSRYLILVQIMSLVGGFLAGSTLILLVPLLKAAGVQSAGPADKMARFFTDLLGMVGLKPEIGIILTVWLVISAMQLALGRIAVLLYTRFTIRLMIAQRRSFHRAMAGARWSFLAAQRNWTLLHAATEDMYRVSSAVGAILRICSVVVLLLIYLGISLFISAKVTLLACVTGGGMVFLLRGNAVRSHRAGEAITVSARELFGGLGGFLEGFKEARCYGLEEEYQERFDRSVDEIGELRYSATLYRINARISFWFGNSVVIASLAYFILTRTQLSTASLLILIYVFNKMMPQFSALEQSIQALAVTIPGYDSFAGLRERCLEAAAPVAEEAVTCELGERLELKALSYEHDDRNGVWDLNLTLNRGETIALVGHSGAGKTTLADILVGLLPPSAGHLVVGGQTVGAENIQSWRDQVGYVDQEAFFSNDSLRANLTWVQSEATDEELWQVLELTQIADFVRTLDDGLETELGERANRLSRGQRQQLALARALLRKPALLILDEATSSLDLDTERAILEALKTSKGERITLLVTHRPSTLVHTDKVIVMADGKVQEFGDSKELTTSGGFLQNLMFPS